MSEDARLQSEWQAPVFFWKVVWQPDYTVAAQKTETVRADSAYIKDGALIFCGPIPRQHLVRGFAAGTWSDFEMITEIQAVT